GVVVDGLVGDAPLRPHPVALFGSAMSGLEGRLWSDATGPGVALAGAGVALGVAAGAGLRSRAAATYVSVAGRGLRDAARSVGESLGAGRLDEARTRVTSLVGRDPSGLDAGELARAVVESLADNTVDAVVAPALWAAVAGAPGSFAYRAANTLDAMVGHRSERYRRFGWASARLDDVLGYLPARLTALLVALVRPARAARVTEVVRRDAPAHPSPNAGVAEAAFAAALDLRLGGTNTYGGRVEHRALMGDGRTPVVGDVDRAVRLSRDVTAALVALLAGPWLIDRLVAAGGRVAGAGAALPSPEKGVG
ncbi:MAG TPA: adenosylcobinamide-phosphate synthase CbiB, partial [Acidimicrobiales bacterium]|nr:adenosylcobinamide-phosphate synthase CbiB [Acidimicrobiales bacterium]